MDVSFQKINNPRKFEQKKVKLHTSYNNKSAVILDFFKMTFLTVLHIFLKIKTIVEIM